MKIYPVTRHQFTLHSLFLIQLVAMGAMEMSGPFWPLHLRQLGQLSPTALAWASSIAYAGPMMTAMLCIPLWGRLGDRIGHKPMLLRALLALTLTQFWIGYTDDLTTVLIIRLLQGALAGFIATAQAYGSALVAADARGKLMARLQIATAVGSMLGPMLGGLLYGILGFQSMNLIAAAICLACTCSAALTLPSVQPKLVSANGKHQEETRPAALVLTPLLGLLLAIILVQAAKMMPQVFFSIFAEQVLHASPWLSGVCYGATALGLCLAAPYWAGRFAGQTPQQVLREVELICWACVALLAMQALSRDIVTFIVSRLFWGVALGALLPVFYGLLSNASAKQDQGLVLGMGNSAAKAGALLGIAIGSLALAWLPATYLFWPVAAAYLICALALRLMRQLPAISQQNTSHQATHS